MLARWTLVTLLALTGTAGAAPVGKDTPNARLLRAIDLPLAANAIRRLGISGEQVEVALDAVEGAGVSAANSAGLLRRAVRASRETSGARADLGEVIRAEINAGKRGRGLMEAIDAAIASGEGPRALGPGGLPFRARPAAGQPPGAKGPRGGQKKRRRKGQKSGGPVMPVEEAP